MHREKNRIFLVEVFMLYNFRNWNHNWIAFSSWNIDKRTSVVKLLPHPILLLQISKNDYKIRMQPMALLYLTKRKTTMFCIMSCLIDTRQHMNNGCSTKNDHSVEFVFSRSTRIYLQFVRNTFRCCLTSITIAWPNYNNFPNIENKNRQGKKFCKLNGFVSSQNIQHWCEMMDE